MPARSPMRTSRMRICPLDHGKCRVCLFSNEKELLSISGEWISPVAEWLNKGLMCVSSKPSANNWGEN
eukprot:9139048-Pyramimonas_sp.AAC.2